MPNLGAPEILMILLVALLVFGPRKLPELGKSLGAGLREFRKSTQGLKEEFDGAMREVDTVKQATTPPPAAVQVISSQPQVVAAPSAPVAAAAVIPQVVTPAVVSETEKREA